MVSRLCPTCWKRGAPRPRRNMTCNPRWERKRLLAVTSRPPLERLPTPESISETVEETINRAFAQRPDLMQQAAEIRTANARLKEARAAYYPSLGVNVSPAIPSL